MASVPFPEQPGCVNDTRTKVSLAAAGHTVQAQSLPTDALLIRPPLTEVDGERRGGCDRGAADRRIALAAKAPPEEAASLQRPPA